MKIGILGAGMIGATAARLWARGGHQLAISNSRGAETLAPLLRELGTQGQAGSNEEVASFGEVVLVAIPYKAYPILPVAPLAGKVVIDAMNYYPQRDGHIDFEDLTSSELVARHLPQSRLVKAFNTMYFQTLASKGRPDAPTYERLALFLAGDDPEAKKIVAGLIDEIGFAPVDTGSLREGGRRQQPGSPIYNQPLTPPQARQLLG
jgi:predicted dinucleotide-binding enzyme